MKNYKVILDNLINMNEELMTRFKDAPFITEHPLDIIVIGAGGISSWAALFLSRLQHNLYVYDFDSFETHNLGGQCAREKDLGKNKAEAIKDLIKEFSPETSIATYGKYEEESMTAPIVICGPDNMAVRKLSFEKWAAEADREIFIDARLSAETGFVYVVLPGMEAEYRKTLFSDSEAEEPLCSFKQTTHCAAMIGSLITSLFTNWLANKNLEDDVREVPFKTEFIIPLMYFNFEVCNQKTLLTV